MKVKTVKVLFNRWGNYVCYVGTQRVMETAEEWKAKMWLAEQLDSGAKESNKSYFKKV